MPELISQHFARHDKDFLFDLVADIEAYPQFLPACQDSKIVSKQDNHWVANLTIGYGVLQEVFVSDIVLDREKYTICATMKEGRLKSLYCLWEFTEKEGGTEIKCRLDFEFHSGLLKKIATPLLNVVADRFIQAFIARAHALTL